MNAIAFPRPPSEPSNIVACIPVRNEAERIMACLHALARQDYKAPFDLVLLLNNCTDRTAELVRAFRAEPAFRMHIYARHFPEDQASAGYARHVAMRIARDLAGPTGVLLCTDADTAVPANWIRSNLHAITGGADAVAGRTVMDDEDFRALPRRLHEDEAAAQLLTELLDAIDCMVDPDPADPWPRHSEHSGASIAVTCAAHDAAGGIPAIASSEDRAFFAALRRIDARVRHAPDIAVTVSGRLDGRAAGGMAETLRRRIAGRDEFLDDCIEPANDRLRRATIRRALRRIHEEAAQGSICPQDLCHVASTLGVTTDLLAPVAEGGSFGAAWQAVEDHSPLLRRRRVPAVAVEAEIAAASSILGQPMAAAVPQAA